MVETRISRGVLEMKIKTDNSAKRQKREKAAF